MCIFLTTVNSLLCSRYIVELEDDLLQKRWNCKHFKSIVTGVGYLIDTKL